MATITIDNKQYQVPPEVADLLKEMDDQKTFYRKILAWIAYDYMTGPELPKMTIRTMAKDALNLYRK